MSRDGRDRLLRAIQVILYVGFIFLWFKGNIYPLKKIKISPLIPLLPLLAILCYRLFLKMKRNNFRLPPVPGKVLWAMLAISLAALAFRVPYLLNSYGMVTSDDAITALMGKHIAQGELAPICFYGQAYMGSLGSHFFALMFKVFGYSVLCFKLSTVLLYLGFVLVHFLFLKDIFPYAFSVMVSLFYCLPLGALISIGFDDTVVCPIFMLLGTSVVYVGYRVSCQKREDLVPWLGFLMGISFWTHQMTAYFILTSLIMMAFTYKFAWKKYATLVLYGMVGFLPMIMQEIYIKFHLVRFLTAGERILDWAKVRTTLRLTASLVAFSNEPTRYIFLGFVLFGFAALLYFALKSKRFLPPNVYNLFLVIFFFTYLFSGHSNKSLIRYLYPLCFCLPVLMLSGFLLIKPRTKYAAASALILVLFLFYNLKGNYSYFLDIQKAHRALKPVVAFLEETGVRYWSGEYWTAYQITALAGEKVVVDSTSVNRYYPYHLFYYNRNEMENFIYLRGEGSRERNEATTLISMLEALGVDYKKKEIGDCRLIYDVQEPIYPRTLFGPVPTRLPRLDAPQIGASEGYLNLIFKNESPGQDLAFRMNVEVPGFSTTAKRFSLADKEIPVKIPFPEDASFPIRYYLDYQGIKIPSTLREMSYTPPTGESGRSREEAVFLYGFGPVVRIDDTRMRLCEKEIRFQWNRRIGRGEKLRFRLYSPFEFSHTHWYGDYFQEVEALVNGRRAIAAKLLDGENIIRLGSDDVPWNERNNVITLRFKYHLPFSFAPFWKTAALLGKIDVE